MMTRSCMSGFYEKHMTNIMCAGKIFKPATLRDTGIVSFYPLPEAVLAHQMNCLMQYLVTTHHSPDYFRRAATLRNARPVPCLSRVFLYYNEQYGQKLIDSYTLTIFSENEDATIFVNGRFHSSVSFIESHRSAHVESSRKSENKLLQRCD